MDNSDNNTQTNHKYFTRSKANAALKSNKKPKKYSKVKIIEHHDEDDIDLDYHKQSKLRKSKNKKKIYRDDSNNRENSDDSDDSDDSDYSDYSDDNDNSDEEIYTIFNKLIKKIVGKMYDDDLDYKPIEGLPEDIIYSIEEEEYIKNLDQKKREQIIHLEKDLSVNIKENIPYRFQILNSSLDLNTKSNIIKKLDHFYSLKETDNEYHKLSLWIENFMKIPFDKYTKPDVSLSDSPEAIINYLNNVKQNLDNSVYGHNIAKSIIIQEISKQITNPKTVGNCVAIQGPPGNGKTTLIKDGVCKAVNRPFAFIALGGLQNSEFLLGHDYTYEGSRNGRIVQILQESGSMDPIIYFDELDKLSNSPKGEEIANLLCHLTDTTQNNSFHDKYFSGINFDLSKATFIFSYNDESKINPILLDRMIKIKTDGFKTQDKMTIAKKYLIPSICKNIGFNKDDVVINDYIINKIINTYTDNEEGVRNLKRCIESIIEKLNVLKLINGYTDNKQKQTNINIQDNNNLVPYNIENFCLPVEITDNILQKFLIINKNNNLPFGLYN